MTPIMVVLLDKLKKDYKVDTTKYANKKLQVMVSVI